MSFSSYLDYITSVDIVVDQINTYSYGMNALLALSYGKVVLSGCEPECLTALNISSSPIINLKPNINHIYNTLKTLLASSPEQLNELSSQSKRYVQKHHDCTKIALHVILKLGNPTPNIFSFFHEFFF